MRSGNLWRFGSKVLAGTVSAALVATPALAEKANQLIDVNGMDAWGAEQALKSRGFKSTSSHKNSRGYTYSYWWDKRDDNCVRVEVYNDTVESIVDAKDRDCGHSGNTAAAAGAVAGLALLGAVLASKSHHHEGKDYDERQTGEFDRGYKDGLHHAQYHNYNRSDAYSHGYEQGADERKANLSHHYDRGGYHQVAQYKDLQGARARNFGRVLEERGFRNVDGFKSGSSAYTIWNKRDTHQCVQVTVADGRVYDIRDIHRHPNCR